MSEKTYLWKQKENNPSSVTPFLLGGSEAHPAVLVIPGGGYGGVCESTEGSPVARKFNELGFHAFVLDYRVAPHRFPAPQQDALRAMRLIRANAKQWRVIPDRVAVCGFSAGGHLACSLGTISDQIPNVEHDSVDAENGVPDAMILCYGVLVLAPWSNQGTCRNLLGEMPEPEKLKLCSLEKQVGIHTPPAFLWHTISDQMVCFRNSVVFAQAMSGCNRPCELHLFPYGDHGMLLGLGTDDVIQWPLLARNFLETQWKMRSTPNALRERYTNRYQAKMEQTQQTIQK